MFKKKKVSYQEVNETVESQEALLTSVFKPVNAAISKRIAAFILDAICVLVVAVGVALLLSVILNYSQTLADLDAKYVLYGIKYYDEDGVLQVSELTAQASRTAWNAFDKDATACALWDTMAQQAILIPSVAIGVGIIIFELIVPLIFKHGRTFGMFLFHIALVTQDHIEVKFINLFIRCLIGKICLNCLIPLICIIMVYLQIANPVVVIAFAVIVLANLIIVINDQRHVLLPDKIAKVFPCELEGQMFFKTVEDLNVAIGKEMANYKRKKIY